MSPRVDLKNLPAPAENFAPYIQFVARPLCLLSYFWSTVLKKEIENWQCFVICDSVLTFASQSPGPGTFRHTSIALCTGEYRWHEPLANEMTEPSP